MDACLNQDGHQRAVVSVGAAMAQRLQVPSWGGLGALEDVGFQPSILPRCTGECKQASAV